MLLAGLVFASLAFPSLTNAQVGTISPPNGTYSQDVVDIKVQTSAGEVSWHRVFNGTGWRFNRHWDGISASFKPVLAQPSGGTGEGFQPDSSASSSIASSDPSGCWIWVDEDWQPAVEGAAPVSPTATVVTSAIAYTPFNRIYNQVSQPLSVALGSVASGCGSGSSISGGGTEVLEGYRRLSSLYVGTNGSYTFQNRYLLKKQSALKLPVTGTPNGGTPQAGSVNLAQAAAVQGWRWSDRKGSWIEYDADGQMSRYGDKNNNIVWIQRNSANNIERVIDGGNNASTGQVVLTLHYNAAGFLVQAKDYPQIGNSLDLPSRSVNYTYDASGRMTKVTDVRGKDTQYEYDTKARLTKITDPLTHATQLAYEGDSTTVIKMTAADGGISDYTFSYDDAKKRFYSKFQGPTTASGRRTEDYTHDRVGDLLSYEVNGRTDLEIKRDPATRSETDTNARGFKTVITRNEYEQITQIQNEDGTITRTQYEARMLNPIETTDELGIKNKFEYDTAGNLTKLTQAAGLPEQRITEYQVDSAGRISQMTRKGGTETNGTVILDVTVQIAYDASGQISETTDPEGKVRQFVHDRTGNLVKYTDPLSHSILFEVDANGNLTKVTDALGHSQTYTYDAAGNLTSYTDARSKATQVTYDAMNRLTQVTNQVSGQFKLQYNAQGLPTSETDEDGRASQAEFNNFLRLTKEIDGLGNATQQGYTVADGTDAGQLGTLIYPTQVQYPTFTRKTKFDERERPTSETLLNPNSLGTEGLISSTQYDARGQIKSETDANGKTSFYAYDALGQLIEITDSLGNKIQIEYDARGNALQIKDPKGNTNKFEYDRNNRLVKETLPLGQTNQYSYDAAGNLSQRIDPNGNTSIFTHDAANRLTEIKRSDASSVLQRTTNLTYDAADNLIVLSDIDHSRNETTSTRYTYDDANRKLSETVTYPNNTTLGYGYAYSAAGLKTRLVLADGTNVDYSYSGHGQLENVTIPGEGSISINQFKWTAPAKITLPGGSIQDKTYDGLLNLESLQVKTPGQQTILSIANTYGKVQELKTNNRTDTVPAGSSTKNSSFTYDDEVRLTQAQTDNGGLFGSDTEAFTLDAVDNRIAHSQVTGAWQYDANNRLMQRGTGADATTYEYDEAGNLTRKTEPAGKVTRYGYDTQNRLTEVKDGTDQLIARYGYDLLDKRLWKEQYRDKSGNALTQALRTYYLYADEGLIAEATQAITLNADQSVTAIGAAQITTQYGPRPDNLFSTELLFIKTKNSNGTDTVAYYHHDQLGTPVQATDKMGNIVWSASYNVFGQATITTPEATADKPTITSNLRLPGQYADEETGLYYNYHRYYDPATDRYITSDPIGLDGGLNTYSYVGGSPTNYTDSSGLIIDTIADIGFILYDLYRLGKDNLLGDCGNLGVNLGALGADVVGTLTPGATGLGLGIRAAKKGGAQAAKEAEKTIHVLGQQAAKEGTAYRAINPAYAESTTQSGKFFQSGAAGRLGNDGIYANSTVEGAIKEFQFHNPGVDPAVFRVQYPTSPTLNISPPSGYFNSPLPFTGDANILTAPSLRAPGTQNLLIREGAVPAGRIQ